MTDTDRSIWSRRRLLASGVGTLAAVASVLGTPGSSGAVTNGCTASSTAPTADRRERLIEILQRHGPELGAGR